MAEASPRCMALEAVFLLHGTEQKGTNNGAALQQFFFCFELMARG